MRGSAIGAPYLSQTLHLVESLEETRRALAGLLHAAGIAVESYASAQSLLASIAALERCPGCIIAELRMPEMDGPALLQQLRNAGFRHPVGFITDEADTRTIVRAMKLGAFDVVERSPDIGAVVGLARAMLAGHSCLLRDVEGNFAVSRRVEEAASRLSMLSRREREVLTMVAEGKSSKIIADELQLSPRTVEIHRARAMDRLAVPNIAAAIRLVVMASLTDEYLAENSGVSVGM